MQHLVDNVLVHKHSTKQVLLLAAETCTDGSMKLQVALSAEHPSARNLPSHSTLLGVELMRQCAIAFAHLSGDVPRGWAFLMNKITFTWHDGNVPTTPEQFAGQANVHLQAVRMRKGRVSELQLEVTYVCRGVTLGRGSGDFSVLPPRAYHAIRRNAPPIPEGNTGPLGTVLAIVKQDMGVLEALLVWNRQDPFIFDHPSDHVPGMLLTSAVLQSHLLLTGSQPLGLSLSCENFAEYDAPIRVSSSLTGPSQTLTTITQSGRDIAFARCAGSQAGATTAPFTGLAHH